ncbi:MAG: hypothetical protein WC273_06475 [Dehalococcoidia bacterium]
MPTDHAYTLAVSGSADQAELLAFAAELEAKPGIVEMSLVRAEGAIGVFNVVAASRDVLLAACRSVEGFSVVPETDEAYADILEVNVQRLSVAMPLTPQRSEALARLERRAQAPGEGELRHRVRLRIFGRGRFDGAAAPPPLQERPAAPVPEATRIELSAPLPPSETPAPPPGSPPEPRLEPAVRDIAPPSAAVPVAPAPSVPVPDGPGPAVPELPPRESLATESLPTGPALASFDRVPPAAPPPPDELLPLPVPEWSREPSPPAVRVSEEAPRREVVRADARPGGAAPLREHLMLVVYPFRSFEKVNEFQDQLATLEGVINLKVGRFYRGALQLKVDYEGIIPLTRRLRELKDFTPVAMNQPDDQTIEITLEG